MIELTSARKASKISYMRPPTIFTLALESALSPYFKVLVKIFFFANHTKSSYKKYPRVDILRPNSELSESFHIKPHRPRLKEEAHPMESLLKGFWLKSFYLN
jgi:hypothetical protein